MAKKAENAGGSFGGVRPEQLRDSGFFPDGFTEQQEANAFVSYLIRDSLLEDLHQAGKISDTEMKELMVSAIRKAAPLLKMKVDNPDGYEVMMMALYQGFRSGS